MADFSPSFPYSTPIELLIPATEIIKGTPVKTYPANGIRLNCSWKTYGGTETTQNGLFSVIDTARIETWYRPDIMSDCRIKDIQTGVIYKILGNPEDINRRHQFMAFKVEAVRGGA